MSLTKNLKTNTPNSTDKVPFKTTRRHNSLSPSANEIILNQSQQSKKNPISKPIPVIIKPTIHPVIVNPNHLSTKTQIENTRIRSTFATPIKTTSLIHTPKSTSNVTHIGNKSFDQFNVSGVIVETKNSLCSKVLKPSQKSIGFPSNLNNSFGDKKPVSIVSPYGSCQDKSNKLISSDTKYSPAIKNADNYGFSDNLGTKRGNEITKNTQQGIFLAIYIDYYLF